MARNQPSMDGYYAAIEWLAENRPHMVEYITALGAPRNDLKCDRAMVVMGLNGKPQLYANDEFLQSLTPAQAAGVLAHEWRHVLLNHLEEAARPKPEWRIPFVLDQAHEALINDSLELTGYELPEDVIRGALRGGHFYGYWDTDESYGPMEEWFLSLQNQPQPPPPPPAPQEEEDPEDQEPQSGSGAQSGNSSPQDADGQEPSEGDGSGEDSESDQESSEGSGGQSSAGGDSSSGSSEGGENPEGSGGESPSTSDPAESSQGDEGGEQGSESGSENDSADSDSSGTKPDGADAEGESCGKRPYREDENGDLREMTEQELDEFLDSLKDFLMDVLQASPLPEDERPSEQELDQMDPDLAAAIDPSRNDAYSKAGVAQNEAEKIISNGKLNLGWVKLLQKINPAVGRDDGSMNARASYNWARPRRTTSLVRGANLPTPGAPRGQGAAGRLKPTALIALDFSQSIDRRLARALSEMAESIPPEHIDARCITFSTYAVHFDFRSGSNAVASGGTDFSCIELEARKIQKETGNYPYVICLTDGQAWFEGQSYDPDTRRSGVAKPTEGQLATNWLWVDVLTEDDERAFRNSTSYQIVRKQPNISALPYDRSKL